MARQARKNPGPTRRWAGVLSRVTYRFGESSGVDVAPLLEQAGLTREEIDDRNARIGVINQIKFVGLVSICNQ